MLKELLDVYSSYLYDLELNESEYQTSISHLETHLTLLLNDEEE